MSFDAFAHKFLAGFGYAIGVAGAKWICTLLPLRGFNLLF